MINQVSPGSFVYWVRVAAPAGSNTILVNQSITTGNFNTLFAIANGSNVFDANCVNGLKPKFTQSSTNGTSGTGTVNWSAPSAGSYYISVKFDATSVGGKTGPTPTTVHYDFSTQGIGGSTSGLDLIKKMTGSAAINPNDTPVRTYLLWASIMP